MNVKTIKNICSEHANREDALIEILHDVQRLRGFLSNESLVEIAEHLNISKADIHGVTSFYHDFLREKPTKPCVKICRAEACQAVGAEALNSRLRENKDIKVQDVYCLGNCALGPAVMIEDRLYGRVTAEQALTILKEGA